MFKGQFQVQSKQTKHFLLICQ